MSLPTPRSSRRNRIIALMVVVIIFVGIVVYLSGPSIYSSFSPIDRELLVVLAWPTAFLVLFWLFAGLMTGRWNPMEYALGADKRYSTSKFQFLSGLLSSCSAT
jgi:hypothetical protein